MGKDPHKAGQPKVPEMGGVALLAVLATVLLTGLVGILDDLLDLRQGVKAFLPVPAALPWAAVRARQARLIVPSVGPINPGIFYPLFLVPLGGRARPTPSTCWRASMVPSGGWGVMAMAGRVSVAWKVGSATALAILFAGLGAALPSADLRGRRGAPSPWAPSWRRAASRATTSLRGRFHCPLRFGSRDQGRTPLSRAGLGRSPRGRGKTALPGARPSGVGTGLAPTPRRPPRAQLDPYAYGPRGRVCCPSRLALSPALSGGKGGPWSSRW